MKILRSIISPESISELISEKYLIGTIFTCQVIKTGGSNDIYKLKTSKNIYFVKVYSKRICWPYTKEHYLYEVNLQHLLFQQNISTPNPIQDKDGNLVNTCDTPEYKKFYVVYSYAEGESFTNINIDKEIFFKIGVELSKIHNISKLYDCKFATRLLNIDFLLSDPYLRIKEFATKNEFSNRTIKIIDDSYLMLCEKINQIDLNKLTSGTIHGDIHPENILLAVNNKISIIDFELCGQGYYLYDLATFQWKLAISENITILKECMNNLINGYISINPAILSEIKYIQTFVELRHFFILGSSAIIYPDRPQLLLENNIISYMKMIKL